MINTNCIGCLADGLRAELDASKQGDGWLTTEFLVRLVKTVHVAIDRSCVVSQDMLKQFIQHHGFHLLSAAVKHQFMAGNSAVGTTLMKELHALIFVNTTFYTPAAIHMTDLTHEQVAELQATCGDKQVRCFAACEALKDLFAQCDCPENLLGLIL